MNLYRFGVCWIYADDFWVAKFKTFMDALRGSFEISFYKFISLTVCLFFWYCFVRENLHTNKGEEEYDRAFDDLQAALWGSAGQPSGAYVLVPAGGVPERVLSGPPDPSDQKEAPRERMALEASHDSRHLNRGWNKSI